MKTHFTKPELKALTRLRSGFLNGSNAGGGYWKDETDLALYDRTFGERIGWKWDAVLGELETVGWQPQSTHVLDWGCGSGIAGRRVLNQWPQLTSLSVHDVSAPAVNFANRKAKEQFPSHSVEQHNPSSPLKPGTLLLISHVINELSDSAKARLASLIDQASEVIWVEAGSYADSRSLIQMRERLHGKFRVILPCPHQSACGLLTAVNEPHWCHHFARVPSYAFQDGPWAQFSRDLGIDLGTLPYSFLVLSKAEQATPPMSGGSRMVGRPREEKGRMKVLTCRESIVNDLTLQKRDDPRLYKDLHKGRTAPRYQWRIEDGKILGDETTDKGLKE